MLRGLVIGTEGIDGIDQTERALSLRHVSRSFGTLYRDQAFISAVAPGLGGALRAFGEYLAKRTFCF